MAAVMTRDDEENVTKQDENAVKDDNITVPEGDKEVASDKKKKKKKKKKKSGE